MTIDSKQIGLFPEGLDERRAAAHPAERRPRRAAQLAEVLGAEVGQFVLLGVAPDVFDRIEFGRVGWQVFQMDLSVCARHEVAHRSAAMNGQAVPDNQQPSADVPLQVLQKLDDLWRFDAAGKKPEVKIPDCQRGHRRKAFPVEGVLQHRRLAARRPGAHAVRSFRKAALVHKRDDSPLGQRFFFISGQRERFHFLMAASSRWTARPVGRWQLQPKPRKIRHTCPG